MWLGPEPSKDRLQHSHIRIIALEKEFVGVAISVGVHQDRAAGRTVTPGAPDFLVVRFQAARQGGVDHGADVSLVDPHAKGDRRDHHLDPAFLEFLLNLLAAFSIDPSAICSGGKVGRNFGR